MPETLSVAAFRQGGGGMMRHETAPHAVQTVTRQYMDMKSPAATPLDYLKALPSMNVSTQDSSGIMGGAITSRSLTDADMAITIDGIPMSSAQWLNEDVDSESLQTISVTPGSAELDLPVTSAAAGVINAQTRAPSDRFGGLADFSYGTNDLSREFLRLDSGKIGNTGIKMFGSFSHEFAKNWSGPGRNEKRHIDFGASKDFDNGSSISTFVSWNHQFTSVPINPTAQQFYDKKHGQGTYNYGTAYDPTDPSGYIGLDGNMWDVVSFRMPVHIVLPSRFSLDLKPYYVYGGGYAYGGTLFKTGTTGATLGPGGPEIQPTINGTSVPAASFYHIVTQHAGIIANLNYKIARHHNLELGYWFDYYNAPTYSTYSAVSPSGVAPYPDIAASSFYENGQQYRPVNTDAVWKIHSIFLQEKSSFLNNRLTVNGGLKVAMISQERTNFTSPAPRSASNMFVPLPQLSIGYRFNEHHQIYLNAEGDYRMPNPSSLTNVYNPATGSYVGNPDTAKPQYSIKEELGYRFDNKYFMADLDLFDYHITNRLISTQSYVNNQSISMTLNGGNQTARGVDLMLSMHPFHHWSPYVSVEYLHATMDSNLQTTGTLDNVKMTDYLRTKGNTAVMSPKVMANFGLTYDDGNFFGNAAVHYTSSEYTSFSNDEKIPQYVTDSLSLGYRFPGFLFINRTVFRLNFNNLTSSFVRTGATGIVNNAHSAIGMRGSTIAASGSPTYYLEPRFNMTGTISLSF